MKKIGFIDYYISEWHANNYPDFLRTACKDLGKDYCVGYVWAEVDVSPVDGVTTDEWCAKFNAEKCSSIEELCQKSDAVIVLAPSNPEKHLEYAEKVFKCGKSAYIDKTFAPNAEVAQKIFDAAKKHGVKCFSSSALRFANEFNAISGKAKTALIEGAGSKFDEYIIHLIEIAVKTMGNGAVKVKTENASLLARTESGEEYTFDALGERTVSVIDYGNGKTATLVMEAFLPYSVSAELIDGTHSFVFSGGDFFVNLIKEIVKFFETGDLPFENAQTVEVLKLRDALVKSKEVTGKWINV